MDFSTILFTIFLSFTHGHVPLLPDYSTRIVSTENTYFTMRMYKELAKEPGNVFFSPISAHAILSFVAQGAEGKTLKEFEELLRVAKETSAIGYGNLIYTLNHLKLQLHMANKIYIKKNYKIKGSFKFASYMFSSEVDSINFLDNKNASININNWCMLQTNNKINDLIKPNDLDADTRMVLLNAIYFQGYWLYKFNRASTKKDNFFVGENEIYIVDMMSIISEFNYVENRKLNAKILKMKYKSDNVSMYIILPNDKSGIKSLERKLNNVFLPTLNIGMEMRKLHVSLPKFKIQTTMPLKDTLTKMGLRRAFIESEANFSELIKSDEPLYISKVIQKAFIEVNEEGAEAAAASGVVQTTRSLIRFPNFHATHPFIFYIEHQGLHTRTILFFGKIVRPE